MLNATANRLCLILQLQSLRLTENANAGHRHYRLHYADCVKNFIEAGSIQTVFIYQFTDSSTYYVSSIYSIMDLLSSGKCIKPFIKSIKFILAMFPLFK